MQAKAGDYKIWDKFLIVFVPMIVVGFYDIFARYTTFEGDWIMGKFGLKLLIITGIVGLISGCYNVSTIYYGDDLYTVTAVSSDEVEANNLAMSKAVRICDHNRYKVEVLERASHYQGMSAEEKALVKTAGDTIGSSKNTTTNYDYKATLHFHCKTITVNEL